MSQPANKTGRRLYGYDNPCSTVYDGKFNPNPPFKTFNIEQKVAMSAAAASADSSIPTSSTPLKADHSIASHVERSISKQAVVGG